MTIHNFLGGARGYNPQRLKNIFAKAGFTLAEVLITLGVIGVVAAITMPALIQKYTNHVVETRLKSFYSQVNQAIRLSEAEYGDKKEWFGGKEVYDGEDKAVERDEWFQKYIGKHMKIVKKEIGLPAMVGWSSGGNLYYLANGSAFGFMQGTIRDWVFFPGNPYKCLNKNSNPTRSCMFWFNYCPACKNEGWDYLYNKSVEPWKFQWDGTEEYLKTHCAGYGGTFCAALIQYNGWSIPKDYPAKVSY